MSEEPRLAADAPPTCDAAGCSEPAAFAYTWDWGANGSQCAKHAALLNQTAQNLSRTVMIAPLGKASPEPLTRDERIALTAKSLVLEAELEEAKARGLDLYRENVKLAGQVQTLTVRGRELDAQLKDSAVHVTELQNELDTRESEHADLVEEVSRLRTLAKFVPTGDGASG